LTNFSGTLDKPSAKIYFIIEEGKDKRRTGSDADASFVDSFYAAAGSASAEYQVLISRILHNNAAGSASAEYQVLISRIHYNNMNLPIEC
jgi:hypothetical protein